MAAFDLALDRVLADCFFDFEIGMWCLQIVKTHFAAFQVVGFPLAHTPVVSYQVVMGIEVALAVAAGMDLVDIALENAMAGLDCIDHAFASDLILKNHQVFA